MSNNAWVFPTGPQHTNAELEQAAATIKTIGTLEEPTDDQWVEFGKAAQVLAEHTGIIYLLTDIHRYDDIGEAVHSVILNTAHSSIHITREPTTILSTSPLDLSERWTKLLVNRLTAY